MADFSTTTPVPGLTTAYTSVLSIINDKFTDLVKGLDTTPTNLPANAIAWSAASSKWRKWNGTAWQDLSSLYAINISGNAATATSATSATSAGNATTVTNGVYLLGDQSIGGIKTFTSQVKLSNGSAAVPSLSFAGEGAADTGFYWSADGYINFTNNGVYSGYIGPGGSIVTAGNITAYGSTTQPSDIRLKTNIAIIEKALDKVDQLTGITYDRIDHKNTRHTGVIAQEVQKVLPEAIVVLDDEQKTLTVAYGNLVGLLIEAIKELRVDLNALKAKVQ